MILRLWNAQASKTMQVNGAKAQSVRNIMSMPTMAKESLSNHVGEFGWDQSAWSDDTLSSKKLLPGYAPRGTCKEWNMRLRVTAASCEALMVFVDTEFRKTSLSLRRKFPRTDIEEFSSWAAVVCNVAEEVRASCPIAEEVLQAGWVDKFLTADATVLSELQLVVAEKSPSFKARASMRFVICALSIHSASCCRSKGL